MASSLTGLSTTLKALNINQDQNRYGSFAEIGAGQEVARHFFQAGQASGTVAKSMSAYDMTFSDEIYGKEESGRYVCEPRLKKMLDKEFSLLSSRLEESRGKDTKFFAFANTVATNRGQGWIGVKFQTDPMSETSEIVLHVKMHDKTRWQATEALGILGVNLLYSAFTYHDDPENIVKTLTDNISTGRVEIDLIRFTGPAFSEVDNRIMCLELVRQGLTDNVVFDQEGRVSQLSEEVFGKSVFILRGQFRPITRTNIELLEKGLTQFKEDLKIEEKNIVPLMEITMSHLTENQSELDRKDFLDRVDTLAALKYRVMISKHNYYYNVKEAVRATTPKPIGMVIGGDQLEYFFSPENYKHIPGGIFQAASLLFDPDTTIYIFPYKTELSCTSLRSFNPEKSTQKLLEFLVENGNIRELYDCDDVESSVLSSEVRKLLLAGDPKWKEQVPEVVQDLIDRGGFFLKR